MNKYVKYVICLCGMKHKEENTHVHMMFDEQHHLYLEYGDMFDFSFSEDGETVIFS